MLKFIAAPIAVLAVLGSFAAHASQCEVAAKGTTKLLSGRVSAVGIVQVPQPPSTGYKAYIKSRNGDFVYVGGWIRNGKPTEAKVLADVKKNHPNIKILGSCAPKFPLF